MIAAQHIENKIASIKPTKVFTIRDLGFPSDWWENIRVKLGRMVKSGQLEKIGRGKFYKPKSSIFGNIGPNTDEIVKDLMFDNGILSGYFTGYSIWNRMGLTSQISNIIVIGTSRRRDSVKRGNFEIRFIMQANKITSYSIPLLQILDSLKLIKQIPDTNINKSIKVLTTHIAGLKEKDLSEIVKLARKYPPRVRALLGAILESLGHNDYANKLKASLNPTSNYIMGLDDSINLKLNNWNIK